MEHLHRKPQGIFVISADRKRGRAISGYPRDIMAAYAGGAITRDQFKSLFAAQIAAFACGKPDGNPNKSFPGGRPSSLIHGRRLTPAALGALLVHFENKIMFQGFLWNLNSFDQEGVQLGKVLTRQVLAGRTEGALKAYADILGV